VNKIRRETQKAVVECQDHLQNEICKLKAQVEAKKSPKKYYAQMNWIHHKSLQASFRLIFGLTRATK
jgi:hypothetical protein